MALEWIHSNIQAFGGDPSRVTLMGESAGASSVAMHVISPRSNGLFNQAILQSAAADHTWNMASNQVAKAGSSKQYIY